MSGRRDIVHSADNLLLKIASRGLSRAAGGTDGAAATLSSDDRHVRQQRISDCGLPNTPDFLRIDEAAELEDVTVGQPGWPHITRAFAKRQGFALVPLPKAEIGETIWSQRAARLLKEIGDVIGGIGKRLENDNDLDPDEAAELLPDADEAVAIAIEIREALKRRAEGRY